MTITAICIRIQNKVQNDKWFYTALLCGQKILKSFSNIITYALSLIVIPCIFFCSYS